MTREPVGTPGVAELARILRTLMSSRKRVGVVGVSGYGGGEILRLCARHPAVQVVYAAGETSAGQRLGSRFPGLGGALADLTIQAFDPRNLPDLDLLFLSLPTGRIPEAAARAAAGPESRSTSAAITASSTAGPTASPKSPARRRSPSRSASPTPAAFPAAALLALAPLVSRAWSSRPASSSTPRPASAAPAAAAARPSATPRSTKTSSAYNLFKHAHTPEMREAVVAHVRQRQTPRVVFIAAPGADDARHPGHVLRARPAHHRRRRSKPPSEFYAEAAFVRVSDQLPHSKWAQGTNLAFVSYAADPDAADGDRAGRDRQPGQRRGRPGRPEHEPDARAGRTTGLELVPMLP